MSGELPEKLYFSISEVARLTGVKPHVLRYWEAEFPSLRPKKNRAGNRSYRKRDIEEVQAIKRLLYDEGYKIDGARRLLADREARSEAVEAVRPRIDPRDALLEETREGLRELLAILDKLKP
jgi:DNA-binding transcriptional MerR regulator